MIFFSTDGRITRRVFKGNGHPVREKGWNEG